jgi:hypothetical protein
MGLTPEAFQSMKHGVFVLPRVHERDGFFIAGIFPSKYRVMNHPF